MDTNPIFIGNRREVFRDDFLMDTDIRSMFSKAQTGSAGHGRSWMFSRIRDALTR